MYSPVPQELRWLFPHIKLQLRLHVGSVLCLTAASLLALVAPLSIRWLIDSVLSSHNIHLLLLAVGLIFIGYEGRAVLNALGNYQTFRATQRTALALRISLLQHVDLLSADYFDRTPVGELLYAFEGPIDEISYFGSDLLPSILRAMIATGVTLSAMAALSSMLTIVIIPIVPVFLILRHRYKRKIGHQADLAQAAKSKFSGFLQEHLSALTQIQLLRETGSQERKALELVTNAVCSQDALWKTGIFFSAFSNLAIVTGIALVITGGSLLVFRAELTIGTLVAFYSLLVQLFEPLTTAMEMYSRAQRTFASVRQIQKVLNLSPTLRQHFGTREVSSGRPLHITFRDVSFRYCGQSDGVCIPKLDIAYGERIAIVGSNGAGKSTLAKLLVRLYDIEAGEITISGKDIRRFELGSLRSTVCYLPAQPILFHRSVADNLRMGKQDATGDELERAVRMVGLMCLDGCPRTLQRNIEPGSSNLSNGERQRVAIARAIVQNPQVLILDETTSSLDPASEEDLLMMLNKALPHATLIVVSHRLHSISWARRILVMQRGQIVGDGQSSTLKITNPFYTELLTPKTSAL
jgi:ABC-type multidrug transport system fused ATPase/permease subunit